MSGKRASERFSDILAKNFKSKIKRYSIRADIDKAVKDLSFIHAGLKLKESDISYKLRYCQAVQIWSEAAGEAIDDLQLTELVTKLKKQLLDKKFLFVEDAGKRSDCLDGFSPKESKFQNFAKSINDEAVGYVTIISESRIFVKPEDNGDELEVEQQEIPFSLELVNPGDKVVVAVDANLGRCGKSLTILKYVYDLSASDDTAIYFKIRRPMCLKLLAITGVSKTFEPHVYMLFLARRRSLY